MALSETTPPHWIVGTEEASLPRFRTAEGDLIHSIILTADKARVSVSALESMKIVVSYKPRYEEFDDDGAKAQFLNAKLQMNTIALKGGSYFVQVVDFNYMQFEPIKNHDPGILYLSVYGSTELGICRHKIEVIDVEAD